MAFNENTEAVMDIADEIVNLINNTITPVVDGEKQINPEGVTDGIVETWEELRRKTEEAVSELDVAWVYIQENPDDPDETDNEEDE